MTLQTFGETMQLKKRYQELDTNDCRSTYKVRVDALRVIIHAAWRASKGKRPSHSYCGEANPKQALALAWKEFEHVRGGANIFDEVKILWMLANVTGETRTMKFNGMRLVAAPGDSYQDVFGPYARQKFRRY